MDKVNRSNFPQLPEGMIGAAHMPGLEGNFLSRPRPLDEAIGDRSEQEESTGPITGLVFPHRSRRGRSWRARSSPLTERSGSRFSAKLAAMEGES
ncbi:hypothetical protein TIFTF001_009155 [Ficus carica]|uniref:Uncharacterized protein n=1 Tax=Ficus carica TaxID=3494 RepID=A0AA88CYP3_FICCA|nr:hypothetical protein TIFTF001_009155 [Ficus carica]